MHWVVRSHGVHLVPGTPKHFRILSEGLGSSESVQDFSERENYSYPGVNIIEFLKLNAGLSMYSY